MVTAAGGAADILSEAAGTGRLLTGSRATVVATILSECDLVLRVAVTTAAHDAADGAVVTAAGGVANDL